MSFTFEEEFKVMDYIVRIEQYQNRRWLFCSNFYAQKNNMESTYQAKFNISRFEYVLANFPKYNLVLMDMVRLVVNKNNGVFIPSYFTIFRRTAEEQKIPFNAQIDKMLFNIGLEFTKQNCVVSKISCYLQLKFLFGSLLLMVKTSSAVFFWPKPLILLGVVKNPQSYTLDPKLWPIANGRNSIFYFFLLVF